MANFSPKKIVLSDINSGSRYQNGDVPDAAAINAPIEAAAYAQGLATNQPDTTDAANYGTPSVSIVEENGTPRLKFSNLGGENWGEEIANVEKNLGAQISQTNKAVANQAQSVSALEKRVYNIESRGDGVLTDNSISYEKDVPIKALTYSAIEKIGGAICPENLFYTQASLESIDSTNDDYRIYNDGDDPSLFFIEGKSASAVTISVGTISMPSGTYTMSGADGKNVKVILSGVETFVDNGDGVTFDWQHPDEVLDVFIEANGVFAEKKIGIMLVSGDRKSGHIPPEEYYAPVKVTEVVSESGNLFDIGNQKIVAKSEIDARRKPKTENGVIYSGGKSGSSSGCYLVVDVRGIANIYVSFNASYADTETMRVFEYGGVTEYKGVSSDGIPLVNVSGTKTHMVGEKNTISFDVSSYNEFCFAWYSTNQYGLAITNLMVSAEDVSYKPYGVIETYEIPAEVQALQGYGEANPENDAEANYIDFDRQKFVAYGYILDGYWYAYPQPQETDISAYISADNYIMVGQGGKLIFGNKNKVAVPSTVTYVLEV